MSPTPDYERARRTGFAGVAACLDADPERAGHLLRTMLDDPVDVAAALSIMVMTCAEIATLWARAIEEDPRKAWRTYADSIACGTGRFPIEVNP